MHGYITHFKVEGWLCYLCLAVDVDFKKVIILYPCTKFKVCSTVKSSRKMTVSNMSKMSKLLTKMSKFSVAHGLDLIST